jgi:hypothetical protein
MANRIIKVSTWRNSTHNDNSGAGYGIRIPSAKYNYLQNWNKIIISNTGNIICRENRTFSKKCPEIRSKLIGLYLIDNKLIQWTHRIPNKLKLEDLGQNVFKLYI